MILTVVWNPTRFHIINVLGKELQIQDHSFDNRSIITIGRMAQGSSRGIQSKVGRSCRSPAHGMNLLTFLHEIDVMKARHFPYSLDLTPSGFFLFGNVKQLLRGAEFRDWNSFFSMQFGRFWLAEKR
jgi:hypothetical protein